MARATLEGPGDEGRSSYQVAITVCDRCEKGYQQGRGELVPVGPEDVEQARCDAQEIGRLDGPHPGRATQSIPPATRRQIAHRDHGRCKVPGCRAASFLDVHHIDPRHEGGTHDPDGLILLCSAHHRALHRGFLAIEGTVSTGLRFRRADGRAVGEACASPAVAAVLADTFQVLRALGYKEGQARTAIDAIRPHVGPDEPEQDVIRRALAVLRRRPTS
jgi:hypothetical protein